MQSNQPMQKCLECQKPTLFFDFRFGKKVSLWEMMVNWRGGDENKVQLMAQLVPISRSTSNWKATNLGRRLRSKSLPGTRTSHYSGVHYIKRTDLPTLLLQHDTIDTWLIKNLFFNNFLLCWITINSSSELLNVGKTRRENNATFSYQLFLFYCLRS